MRGDHGSRRPLQRGVHKNLESGVGRAKANPGVNLSLVRNERGGIEQRERRDKIRRVSGGEVEAVLVEKPGIVISLGCGKIVGNLEKEEK